MGEKLKNALLWGGLDAKTHQSYVQTKERPQAGYEILKNLNTIEKYRR